MIRPSPYFSHEEHAQEGSGQNGVNNSRSSGLMAYFVAEYTHASQKDEQREGERPMSVHVMSWVLRHSEEKLGNRLVLLVLADHAGEDGADAFPKIDTIAAEARLSRSQTIRCLASLQESGAIEHTGERKSGTKIYRVVMEEQSHIATGSEQSHPGDEGGRIEASSSRTMRPEPSLEPSKSETSKTLAAVPAAPAYDPLKGMKVNDRNLPWDALVEVTQADETVEKGKIGQALKLIRGYMAPTLSPQAIEQAPTRCEQMIAEQVRARARMYRQRWPRVELTPTALASNWSRVLTPAPGGSPDTALDAAQRGLDAGRRTA